MTNNRLTSKIYKQLIQFNIKKTNSLIKKWAEDLSRHFPKKICRWQQAHEEMLDIANHQRNADQNHELAPHTCQMVFTEESTNYKCWQGCGEKGPLAHCLWD